MMKIVVTKKIVLGILLSGIVSLGTLNAQYRNSNKWKLERSEINLSVGVAGGICDIAGADEYTGDAILGSDPAYFRHALTAGYRYFISPNLAAKGSLIYGRLAGDDQESLDPFRRNRNLHFRTDIIELSATMEFHLYGENIGHRFSIKGAKGEKGNGGFGIYAFTGFSTLFFNPKAKLDDVWYTLSKYNTEGQGLPNGPQDYSRITYAIPFGGGLRWKWSKRLSFNAEFSYRATFTDYLDDVGGYYYDPELMRTQAADPFISQDLANPAIGYLVFLDERRIVQVDPEDLVVRGNSNTKDAYIYTMVGFNYKIIKSRYSRMTKRRRTNVKIIF